MPVRDITPVDDELRLIGWIEVLLAEDGDDCDSARSRIEVMPTGTFRHHQAGDMTVTRTQLDELAEDINKRGDKISVDFDHSFVKGRGTLAAGWFVQGSASVETGSNGADALFADVDWTPAGAKAIRDKLFRFISPEWLFRWRDSAGKVHQKARLFAAALTNRPFFDDMRAVNICEQGLEELLASVDPESQSDPRREARHNPKEKSMDPKLLESLGLTAEADDAAIATAIATLSERAKKADELETTVTELEKKVPTDEVLAGLLASAKKGEDAAAKLEMLERDTLIADAIRERKIDPAQKEHFETLYAAAPEGLSALFASMKAGSWEPIGSEGQGSGRPLTTPAARAGDIASASPPTEITIDGATVPVDPTTSKIHTRALEIIVADGKATSYTADDYEAAAIIAANEQGIRL